MYAMGKKLMTRLVISGTKDNARLDQGLVQDKRCYDMKLPHKIMAFRLSSCRSITLSILNGNGWELPLRHCKICKYVHNRFRIDFNLGLRS